MKYRETAPEPPGHVAARIPGRVHWMELFFDLVFVVFVGQLAHGIHGDPGWVQFGNYVLLFFPAWWAWVNIVSVINLLPDLSSRALGVAMLGAMAAAGLMAAAAPEALGDRAWAFSLANAALRAILLVLWLHRHHHGNTHGGPWRIWIYNGGTAAMWLVAAFLPFDAAILLWAGAIALEVAMAALSGWLWADRGIAGINIEHASERLGLFMIIVLGESVFTIITEASEFWTPGAGAAASLGFLIVALLGWAFFQYGTGTMSAGLEALRSRSDFAGIMQTTLFLPFLLVLGVTAIAGAIATAIPDAGDPLPLGSGICLGGGIALFYLSNATVALRYGQPVAGVLPWALPTVLLSLALIPLSAVVSSGVVLALAVILLLAVTAYVELRHWSQRRTAALTTPAAPTAPR